MPGKRITPPPCRRCGRLDGYYSAGLCDRCHRHAPQHAGSCRDCHAWGVFRVNKWLCTACMYWRKHHPLGECRICAASVAVNDEGACRLCWRVFLDHGGRASGIAIAEATRFGQQLSLANMGHSSTGRRRGTRREKNAIPGPNARHDRDRSFQLAEYTQLVLFDAVRDLRAGRAAGFTGPADPAMSAHLEQFTRDHAARHGWSKSSIKTTLRGLAIVLSLQDTPGAALRATEILQLHQIGITTLRALEICRAAEVLHDDRPSVFEHWFTELITELPVSMRGEVRRWQIIMSEGSTTVPRSRPRSQTTVRLYLRWCMPALRHWAAAGHVSLREITRDEVLAVLPDSGNPRAAMGQGLRCLFRVAKAHRIVFLNPMRGLSTGTHQRRQPLPLPAAIIRDGLNSPDPATAAVVALTAFHALRSGDLRTIQLTDLHSGRLRLDGRIIPLAAPVRTRIRTWISERERRWPDTANPYLFVSKRTALRLEPVGVQWVTSRLGLTAQAIREDRILDELNASGGDVRRLCDLFGLSIAGAARYTTALHHPDHPGSAAETQALR